MRVVAFLFAAVAYCVAPAARAADPLTTLPYRIAYDGWITVEATVNGQGPYDFIIDTGATLTLVFSNVTEKQDFPLSPGPPKRILGLNSEQSVDLVRIGDIAVGDEVFADHLGVVLTDWSTPENTPGGIIGLDFLSQYLVVFDAQARTMSLYDADIDKPRFPRDWSSAPMKRRQFKEEIGALFVVEGRIQSQQFDFILDLGATTTLINFPAFRRLIGGIRINESGGSPRNASRISDVSGDTERARLVRMPRMRLRRARWAQPILLVFNATVFEELGVANAPFGLFGVDLLRDRSFALDFKNERIFISRTSVKS
ncbi:MAG: aspartyl protease family protein [Pseudomonadota bacterium]